MVEDKDYLSKQILTYIGNKRALLEYIKKYVTLLRVALNHGAITKNIYLLLENELAKYYKVIKSVERDDFIIKNF